MRELASAKLLAGFSGLRRANEDQPWLDLPNFAGLVGFLPAHPIDVGADGLPLRPTMLGTIELDVITCHHPAYYRGDLPVATDTEDPIPVVFPAVAAGHVFVFAFTVTEGCPKHRSEQARKWLADGLATFGAGAKTAAGYGWFDTCPAIGEAVNRQLHARAEAQRKEQVAQAEKLKQQKADEARKQAREELEKATANMTEDEKLQYALKQLQEPQFHSKLDRWKDLTPGERLAIYHLMRSEKAALWLDPRKKATEGKQKEKTRWGQLVQDLFQMAKDRKEKVPS